MLYLKAFLVFVVVYLPTMYLCSAMFGDDHFIVEWGPAILAAFVTAAVWRKWKSER